MDMHNKHYCNFYVDLVVGRDADHSLASSAEIKKALELYLFSPQAPTWRIAGSLYLLPFFRLCLVLDALRITNMVNIWKFEVKGDI
jgi:hypothetical protein